ncbi:uncharacterized protein LOC124362708 [Homalodisca vitripennis]|uniref:uncharacterized protein LOC124362708 n=1 Tax=Homalodisca vitripennis TaxID=197043 RepID=UPI001EECD046|nr:uncharacterized protein LOC124362708 [Homalodisca vitripennis]
MKTALPLIAVLASFLWLASDRVNSAPAPHEPAGNGVLDAPAPPELAGRTFFDLILNIPRSILNSVNKELNDNGVKCKDGSLPVDKDGKGTCHDNVLAAPAPHEPAGNGVLDAPAPPELAGRTFFDLILNIPRSILNSVNKELNDNGVKCKDGSLPVDKDGKGTCHDNALAIPKSAIDSVNDLLNG